MDTDKWSQRSDKNEQKYGGWEVLLARKKSQHISLWFVYKIEEGGVFEVIPTGLEPS